MTELSPQAQAVLDAYKEASDGHYINGEWIQDHTGQIAAAFRAVADQVVPADAAYSKESPWQVGFADRDAQLRRDILAIAAELEGTNG